jgi:hypothetical protein
LPPRKRVELLVAIGYDEGDLVRLACQSQEKRKDIDRTEKFDASGEEELGGGRSDA